MSYTWALIITGTPLLISPLVLLTYYHLAHSLPLAWPAHLEMDLPHRYYLPKYILVIFKCLVNLKLQ